MFDPRYIAQARLILRCLTQLEDHPCFALKGGTALNLFVHDLPRISVDIDLTYLPLRPRDESLDEINRELRAFGRDISNRIPRISIRSKYIGERVVKLTVTSEEASIKIEPNLVLRGSVYPPESRRVCEVAQRTFEAFARVLCLTEADLYGGKLCAALDRQHPRDLFDVKLLLEGVGITQEIRRAFVVYLAGHNRPMNELLNPNIKDISETFETQFVGMTTDPVSLGALVEIQRQLPEELVTQLDDDERAFLLSMKRGDPDWTRLGFDHLEQLPALQWKLQNIRTMRREKHRQMVERLERILDR
jgi:predicted nucleotidyltransferase component of viral defense system